MENVLQHHGILGMKWGVRRYQNADGTLTAAGKARRNASESTSVSEDYKKAHSGKSTKSMSDKELKETINRLQMEQQYSELKMKSNLVVKGSSYVATGATILGTAITLYNNSNKLVSIGKSFVDTMK